MSSAFNRLIHYGFSPQRRKGKARFIFPGIVGVADHSRARNLLSSRGQWKGKSNRRPTDERLIYNAHAASAKFFSFEIFLFTCNVHARMPVS